jgi:periplasmic protein TonB
VTAAAATLFDRPRLGSDAIRWSACLLLVLGLHAVALDLLFRHAPAEPTALPSEAMMIDLAPEPVSPAAEPEEAPPEPEPVPPEPEPVPPEPEPIPPEPEPPPPESMPPEPIPPPEVMLPAPPPPPPSPPAVRQPPRAQRPAIEARRDAAAPAALEAAPVAAAPPAPMTVSNAVPTWQGLMLGRLQRFKRYPDAARLNREEGVAYLTFSMDRAGHVLSAAIARSSGSQALDSETLALVRRAEPLPAPPPEMPGDPVTLTVPVRFSLR